MFRYFAVCLILLSATTFAAAGEDGGQPDYDKAIAGLNMLLRVFPKCSPAYSLRGSAWQEKGEFDKAIADCNEALRLDPESAMAYNNRGAVWAERGQYDKAIADYSEALRLDLTLAVAYYNRGNAWGKKGEHDEAITDYEDALWLNPKFVAAYCNRGNAWLDKGEYDKAIADFDVALRLDRNDSDTLLSRGCSWLRKGVYDKAIADYSEALRLDPKSEPAYCTLAWILATCPDAHFRNGTKAVKYATKACELAGWEKWHAIVTLAAACAEAGDFPEAIHWEEVAINLAENESDKAENRNHLELYQQGKPYRTRNGIAPATHPPAI